MKWLKEHINSNVVVGIIGVTTYVLSICCRLSSYDIPSYETIMSDTISFASFITCLMFIGLAYLPKSNSQFMKAADALKTNITLMHQILITITIYFSIAIVCVGSLAFSRGGVINIPLTSLWLGLFISGLLEVSLMLSELFQIIIYIAKGNQK